MLRHRCTGLLLMLLLCLVSSNLSAQTPEDLLNAGDYAAAAKAFTARGERSDHFAAAEAWVMLDSLSLAQAAYALAIDAGQPDSLSGLAQHKIGLLHYWVYQEPKAVIAYKKAIAIRDQAFSGAHKDRAHSRLNLAQTLIELGSSDTAAVILQEAIDIYSTARPTDSLNWIRGLNSLALLSEDARDYQIGINAVRQSTAMIDQLQNPDPYDVFDAWYAAGRTNLIFAEIPAAKTAAQKALEAAKATGDPNILIQSLTMLAGITKEEEQYAESLNLHTQALELSEGLDLPEAELGVLHFNLALSYGKLDNTQRALFHSQQAEGLLKDDPYYFPRLMSITGDIHRKAGDFPAASNTFNRGIGSIAGTSGNLLHYPSPEEMEPVELEILADLLGDRADVLESLGQPEQALKDYELLFDVQDNLRERVTSDESRRYLSKNLRQFFDRAIALEFSKYAKQADQAIAWRAFELSERAKAYSLLTAIQNNRASMPRQEAALRTRIASLERSATAGSKEEQLLVAARLQLDRLLRLTKKQEDQSIPTFNQQEFVDFVGQQNTDLLAFHLGADQGFRWHLQPDGSLTFSEIGQVETLPATISRWRDAISQSAYRRKSLRPAAEQQALDAAFMENGTQLYRQLLGEPVTSSRVCILPDGPLTVLPFGALPVEEATAPLEYDQVKYFQDDAAIHYAYSARVWLQLTQQPAAEYDQNLLALAPTFRGETSATTLTRAVKLRDGERALTGLSPLKFNRPEVEEIVGLIPRSTAFYGADADRQHFLDNLTGARIIHLSTHGVVNAAEPALSFVAFSQLGDSLEYEEMLYYNDLSALPLTAELAVLSACETSLGAYVPGETSLSLSSAFTAAGARSTLTTLWQVDDAATKDLIVNFYRELAAGKDRSTALKTAQEIHQQGGDYAHPFYWSAMTLYGDAGSLALESGGLKAVLDSVFTPYLVTIVLALFSLYLLYRRRRQPSD